MESLNKLRQIAANPGGYGDSVKVRRIHGGGLSIEKLDGSGETILDPDQVNSFMELMSIDPEDLKKDVAERLAQKGAHQLTIFVIFICAVFGFLIGIAMGTILF